MRISRFLLMEGIKKALQTKYIVEKEQTFSMDENTKKNYDNQYSVKLELKDTNPVTLRIKNMDLK